MLECTSIQPVASTVPQQNEIVPEPAAAVVVAAAAVVVAEYGLLVAFRIVRRVSVQNHP